MLYLCVCGHIVAEDSAKAKKLYGYLSSHAKKIGSVGRKIFLRFPTLVGNLSVFVLSFIIKVSDFSWKPFCFRFVFY